MSLIRKIMAAVLAASLFTTGIGNGYRDRAVGFGHAVPYPYPHMLFPQIVFGSHALALPPLGFTLSRSVIIPRKVMKLFRRKYRKAQRKGVNFRQFLEDYQDKIRTQSSDFFDEICRWYKADGSFNQRIRLQVRRSNVFATVKSDERIHGKRWRYRLALYRPKVERLRRGSRSAAIPRSNARGVLLRMTLGSQALSLPSQMTPHYSTAAETVEGFRRAWHETGAVRNVLSEPLLEPGANVVIEGFGPGMIEDLLFDKAGTYVIFKPEKSERNFSLKLDELSIEAKPLLISLKKKWNTAGKGIVPLVILATVLTTFFANKSYAAPVSAIEPDAIVAALQKVHAIFPWMMAVNLLAITMVIAGGTFARRTARFKDHFLGRLSFKERFILAVLFNLLTFGGYGALHLQWSLSLTPAFELAPYAVLAVCSGLATAIFAQWYFIRTGRHQKVDWRSLAALVLLNIFHGTLIDETIYGGLHSLVALWSGLPSFVAPFIIAVFDFVIVSPLFAEPSAFDFYAQRLEAKSEHQSKRAIRRDLLGFYALHGWFWFGTTVIAMAVPSPIISFMFINIGILYWNVAFELELYNESMFTVAWMARSSRWRWLVPAARRLQYFYSRPWLTPYLRHGRYAIYLLALIQQLARLGFSPSALGIVVAIGLIARWAQWRTSLSPDIRWPGFSKYQVSNPGLRYELQERMSA